MARRHPNYDPSRRRERDVDVEKEIQRFRDELNKKENELQVIKVQKVCQRIDHTHSTFIYTSIEMMKIVVLDIIGR